MMRSPQQRPVASPVARRTLERLFMRLQLAILEQVAVLIDQSHGLGTVVPQPIINPAVIPPGSGDWDGPINANVVRRIQGIPVSEDDPLVGQVLTDVGGVWTPATPASGGHTIQDEGVSLTQRPLLDFAGTGVTVTDSGGTKTLVTIPGNTGHTIEDEGTPLTARTSLNFVGAGVTATDAGGKTVVTIPGAVDTDEKAKVSSNDTTPGYLNGKLVAGTGITLTENNDGSNETLTIAAAAVAATTRWEILVDQEAGELIWAGAAGSYDLIYAEVPIP